MALKQRHNKWQVTIRVPKDLQESYGGKQHLYQIMAAQDRRSALLESKAWMLAVKAEWASRTSGDTQTAQSQRTLYETLRSLAAHGKYTVADDPHSYDDVTAGIEERLARMSDRVGQRDLTQVEQVEVSPVCSDPATERTKKSAGTISRRAKTCCRMSSNHKTERASLHNVGNSAHFQARLVCSSMICRDVRFPPIIGHLAIPRVSPRADSPLIPCLR